MIDEVAKKKITSVNNNKNEKNIALGEAMVKAHPLFESLFNSVSLHYQDMPAESWAYVTSSGVIYVNDARKGQPKEWAYVIAHCLLHLGLNHKQSKEHM